MKLNPQIQLSFNGQCEAAFRSYEQHLHGSITFMLTWGDSPMKAGAPPGFDAKILHATITIGNAVITGADVAGYEQPTGFSIELKMDDTAGAERVFLALAESGTIVTPIQETFWAARFGMVVDRFGIPWAINCERAV